MNRLKKIISSLGISQKEFSQSLGMSPGSISMYISGERQLTKIVAFLIEKTYGISSEWLLYGTGEMYIALTEEEKQVQEQNSLLRQLERKPEIREILEVLMRLDKPALAKLLIISKTFLTE